MSAKRDFMIDQLTAVLLRTDWERVPLHEVLTALSVPEEGVVHWDESMGDRPKEYALVDALLERFPSPPHHARDQLFYFLTEHLDAAAWHYEFRGFSGSMAIDRPQMGPVSCIPLHSAIPHLVDLEELADWLSRHSNEHFRVADLTRLADRSMRGFSEQKRLQQVDVIQHAYRLKLFDKGIGTMKRPIEVPVRQLAVAQQVILKEILERVEIHPSAHGFVRGRSVKTAAQVHAHSRWTLQFDLRHFFPTIGQARVQALFFALGYPSQMARIFSELTTTASYIKPQASVQDEDSNPLLRLPHLLRHRHLPQGACTSPAISNLIARSLDVRLEGLAKKLGVRYSRYADDLIFSSDKIEECPAYLMIAVPKIVHEEGFWIAPTKTKKTKRSMRQEIVGLSVGADPKPSRAWIKQLEAVLIDVNRNGFEVANREGLDNFTEHLRGKIAYLKNFDQRRAERFLKLWQERIDRDRNA